MSNDDFAALFVVIFLFGCGALAGYAMTKSSTDNWWRDELARRGHAHYYLDGNNQRQWNWKEKQ